MSRHEGVSCDSCLKGNFRGRRYKCLVCYDYDLCASCYEAGATTTRHTVDHPMQCILTNSDFDLFYSGEAFTVDQPQSFTCPVCGKLGYTEATLTDHVTSEHSDATNEVVCPICASQLGGEPNLVTDDFTNHLMSEHRSNQRDLISFLDEPSTATRHVRRIPHPRGGGNSSRPRRSNMHFSSTAAMSSLSPSANRDNVDPIAELLSQLSGVRRGNPGPTSVHLQQLQMQLQLERQQVRAARQQLERIPKRQAHSIVSSSAAGSYSTPAVTTVSSSNVSSATSVTGSSKAAIQPSSASGEVITASSYSIAHPQNHPQTIISKILDTVASESELQFMDVERADRSIFMKNILLSTLNSKKEEPSVHKNRRTPPSIVKPSSSAATTAESIVPSTGISESSSSSVLMKPAEQPAPSSSATLKRLSATTKSVLPPSQIPQQPRSSLSPATPNSNGTSNNQSSTSSLPPPPPPSLSTTGQNRTAVSAAPPTTPRVLHSPNNLGNIRDVLVGSNFSTETSRRKPICPIETLNQTSEPPTSH